MLLLKEADFRKEIKTAPRAGYVFVGEEDYLKGFALRAAEEAFCPDSALSIFNVLRIDGLDLSPQSLLDALTPLPMMCERKLVLVTGFHFQGLHPEEIDALFEALEMLPEFDYNTLIFSLSAAFDPGNLPKKASPLLQHERVDWMFEADYTEGSALDRTMKTLLQNLAYYNQLKGINEQQKRDFR